MTLPFAGAVRMRDMDRLAIEEYGIPGLELMEAAGRGATEVILRLAPAQGPILILCGPGNNGGDGFVVARLLHEAARDVTILLAAEPAFLKGDALANYQRLPSPVTVLRASEENLEQSSELIRRAAVLVDALLGTGLMREVGGLFGSIIQIANSATAMKFALDIPSGLSSDHGHPLGIAFQAHHTVTFGQAKPGQFLFPGSEFCGHLHIVDIGIPQAARDRAGFDGEVLDQTRARLCLTARNKDSHKGTYGHLLLMAGSEGKSGAALLAASGALRSGLGLLTCATDDMTRLALACRHPEAMSASLCDSLEHLLTNKSAVVCGPGWGLNETNAKTLQSFASRALDIPLLLDADALTLTAEHGQAWIRERTNSGSVTVLTPHPGEAGRLLKCDSTQVQADRISAARKLAVESGAYVVLKGAQTLVTNPGGYVYLCPFGNPGMACGGTGDVLAGLLGGLLAQGLETTEALIAGVCLHALAGDIAAQMEGQHGLIASDLVRHFGTVWTAWERNLDVACSIP